MTFCTKAKYFSLYSGTSIIRNSRFQSFVSNYGGFRYKEVLKISKEKEERCTGPHADSERMQFIQRNQSYCFGGKSWTLREKSWGYLICWEKRRIHVGFWKKSTPVNINILFLVSSSLFHFRVIFNWNMSKNEKQLKFNWKIYKNLNPDLNILKKPAELKRSFCFIKYRPKFLRKLWKPVAPPGGNTGNVPPPPEIEKNCCRKMMLFPKALFLATTFPKIDKNSIFLMNIYQKISKFSQFPNNLYFSSKGAKN